MFIEGCSLHAACQDDTYFLLFPKVSVVPVAVEAHCRATFFFAHDMWCWALACPVLSGNFALLCRAEVEDDAANDLSSQGL